MMKKGVQTHIQIPLPNNCHHDQVLKSKVILGSLHQMQSISPLELLKLTDKENQQLVHQGNTTNTTQNHQEVSSVDKRGKSTNDHVQKIIREVYLR